MAGLCERARGPRLCIGQSVGSRQDRFVVRDILLGATRVRQPEVVDPAVRDCVTAICGANPHIAPRRLRLPIPPS